MPTLPGYNGELLKEQQARVAQAQHDLVSLRSTCCVAGPNRRTEPVPCNVSQQGNTFSQDAPPGKGTRVWAARQTYVLLLRPPHCSMDSVLKLDKLLKGLLSRFFSPRRNWRRTDTASWRRRTGPSQARSSDRKLLAGTAARSSRLTSCWKRTGLLSGSFRRSLYSMLPSSFSGGSALTPAAAPRLP